MSDKPEVGFGFGVEGDQSLLAVIQQLRNELKNLKSQQEQTASSAEVLHRAWSSLIKLAGTLELARFARDVFDTAVAIGKLNQITGISTQTLSVYYKAASDVKVSHEALDKGVIRLSDAFVKLQAGNAQVAMGFRLLNLQAKDFIGLNADEKIRKVTDAFAKTKEGPERSSAARVLLGKAGPELLPAFEQLGGEEFQKAAEQAERLGLILDKDMTDGALRAAAALSDLKGTAEGATAHFETGLLPAVADTADGLVDFTEKSTEANKKNEDSFRSLGELAGGVLKYLILGLLLVGTTAKDVALAAGVLLETVGREIINIYSTQFRALDELLHGRVRDAWETVKSGGKEAAQAVKDGWDAVAKSIADSDARVKAFFDKAFPATPTVRKPPKPKKSPGDVTGGDVDRLNRAELAGIKERTRDELALYRALTQQKLEQDRTAYEQGLISLEEYFDRRAATIRQGFVEEAKALGADKLALQEQLAKAQGLKAVTPQQQAAKQQQIQSIENQIEHVDRQLGIEAVKRDTELFKNETDRFNARQDHLQKELEEQKKLADMEGDRARSAQLANQIEDIQISKTLAQLGYTKEQIEAFLREFGAARNVRTESANATDQFSGSLASFEARKASIEARAAAGPLAGGIQQYEAERQLRDLYAEEIPLLEQKLETMRQLAAQAQQGSALQQQLNKQIADEAATIEKLRLEANKLSNTWKVEVQQAVTQTSQNITHGLNGWLQGHERFGQAVKNMWNSIVMTAVNAIENIAAKWIEQHLLMAAVAKITKFLGLDDGADKGNEKKAAQASGSIQIDAAQASADVFAQAIAKIPFPANLAAAPALAAATEAQIMAFQAQAIGGAAAGAAGAGFYSGGYVGRRMFEGGGSVHGPRGRDVIPAWVTDGEYVVSGRGVSSVGVDTLDAINRGDVFRGAFLPPIRQPAPYTTAGLSRYSQSAIAGLQPAAGGAGGKSITVEQQVSLSSLDAASFRDRLDDHLDHIADGIKQRMRDFRF